MHNGLIPKEMYLPRKSLEVVDLPRLEYLAATFFNQYAPLEKITNEKMERFWAKEIAAAEVFYVHNCDYEQYLPGRYFTYKRLVDILKEHTDIKDKNSLEVGCGSGISLVMLAKKGAKCTGIDQSYIALEFLRRNAEKEGLEGVVRNQGDFFSTEYEDNQFDISYNLGVFEHLSQREQKGLITEMARITREMILIAVPNPDSPLFKTLLYCEKDLESVAPGNIYPDRGKHFYVDLRALLESVGFKAVSYSGILLAPSQDINPKTLDDTATEFFSNIPKIIPAGKAKERIRNLIGFWECVEKATSTEELRKYAWFRYIIGSKNEIR